MPKSMKKLWDIQELVLTAKQQYANPYLDVDVWIDLEGPGFKKRVYGFWDGGQTFKVRFTAVSAGDWSYVSGASVDDSGLCGIICSFTAEDWTEAEKAENPARRGMLCPDKNGHGFVHPDGSSFFMLGDTWWAVPTYRFPWSEDETERPIEQGYFKDLVKYRKKQGYNTIAMLAGHPTWANDGHPPEIMIEPGVYARCAWRQPGTESAKDMHNEGGRPFLFPGKVAGYEDVVPDFGRINPEYFKHMDKKVDYLQSMGFLSFIEVARRDLSTVWKKHGGWPETYARYVQYIFARYQANFCLLSPIHFDWPTCSIHSKEYNEPINLYFEKYGPPPFGTLLGTNASPSTLVNFGGQDEAPWLTFHQNGNWREHDHHWYLTEMFHSSPAMPAIAGEPYYPGFPNDTPPADSQEAEINCRAGLYGSFLSGALGGIIYGVEGLWGADIEPQAKRKIWESIQLESGKQAVYLESFVKSEGDRFMELIPNSELVSPNKAGDHMGYRGWAFCAVTKEKDYALIYLEKDCPAALVRGFEPNTSYTLTSFDPITGKWGTASELVTNDVGRATLTDDISMIDIGFKLIKNS